MALDVVEPTKSEPSLIYLYNNDQVMSMVDYTYCLNLDHWISLDN